MKSFIGWNNLRRKTKIAIFAASGVSVVGVAVGLGFGIVAYQDANYVNNSSDPSLIVTDLSQKPQTPVAPVVPDDPASEQTDPQEQADVTSAIAALSALRRTTLTSNAFNQASFGLQTWTSAAASALGITLPDLPEGLTITFSKLADSALLTFTVAKNRSQGTASATVNIFSGDDELALDNVSSALASLTRSSFGRDDFTKMAVAATDYGSSFTTSLGLDNVAVDESVTVSASKAVGSSTLYFELSKGDAKRELRIEVTTFTADDESAVATVALALTTLTTSSLQSSAFFRMEQPQMRFDASAARIFGVPFPANLIQSVTILVSKVTYSTSLTFVVSQGVSLKVVAVPVNSFTGDNPAFFAATKATLAGIATSTLTREAFEALDQPTAPFVPLTAQALGIEFPAGLWGEDITVSKPAGSLVITYVIKKNGSQETQTVTPTNFANNDRQLLDALASSLEELTTTSLDQASFKQLVLRSEEFDASLATRLGFPFPSIPDGVTVLVSKAAGSADVAFEASKGSLSASSTATVTVFAGGDKLDVDAAAKALANLTTTSLTSAAFMALVQSSASWTNAVASSLGLTSPSLPSVTVRVSKSANSAALSFVVSKGTATPVTVSVTVVTFLGDEQASVNALAASLRSINVSSLTRTSFQAIALPESNLTSSLAQTLGITLPTVPSGLSVRVVKSSGSAQLSFTVSKGQLSASASATVTAFTGDLRVALQTATEALNALTVSSLTNAAFKNAVYAAAIFDASLASSLGLTYPALPNGVSVKLSKGAGTTVLNFALTNGTETASTTATVSKFTGDDLPDVTRAATVLSGLITTKLTTAAFNAADIAQTPFTTAVATTLGLTYPSNLPAGVTVSVAKTANTSVLAFTLTKGDARQTASVVVTNFAPPVVTPPPSNDNTISPGMQRAVNYLSGFVDVDFTDPLPDRIFNYVRSTFVSLVGGAAVSTWEKQNKTTIVIDNSVIIASLRTLMVKLGIDIGTPSISAMYQLYGPMTTILRQLLSDPDISSLGLRIDFKGNAKDTAIYAEAYIPVLPSDPTVVKTAKEAVTTDLPNKYYSYASTGPQDPPIQVAINDFKAKYPL